MRFGSDEAKARTVERIEECLKHLDVAAGEMGSAGRGCEFMREREKLFECANTIRWVANAIYDQCLREAEAKPEPVDQK